MMASARDEKSVARRSISRAGAQPQQIFIVCANESELLFCCWSSGPLHGFKFRRYVPMNFRVTIGKRYSPGARMIGCGIIGDLILYHVNKKFSVVNAVVAFVDKNIGQTR